MSNPIEEKWAAKMNDLARRLDREFNDNKTGLMREVGFVLLVFPFGGPGERVNYISNANRDDIRKTMQEMLARWEAAEKQG